MNIRLSRRQVWITSALTVALLSIPTFVFAQDFNQNLYNFFGALVLGWLQFLAQFVGMVIHFLIVIAQYNDFVRNDVVTQGWNIVTSVANMFFIIALLVIALGTVLRIQNYRYNRLLGTVIVMAFLVNFSKTIAAFFIQTSQVVMLTFVNAFKDAAFGNFAVMMGLDKVLTFSQTEPNNYAEIFVGLLVGLFLLTVAFITVVALAIVLVFRIVYLWILVILSPLAYALRVLPNTERFAGQWWSEFGKWTTNGPVIAFFIWLALAILSQSGDTAQQSGTFITGQPSIKAAADAIPPAERDQYFGISELMDFNNFTSFIVGIVFLWVGLQQATAVGGMAGGWIKKVTTGGLAAYGALSGLNALRDRTVAPIQGYMRQREQRRQEAIAARTAGLSNKMDQLSSATVGNVGRVAAGARGATVATVTGKGLEAAGQAARFGFAQGTRGEQQRQQRMEAYRKTKAATRGTEMDINNLPLDQVLGLAASGSAAEKFTAIQRALALNGLKKDDPQHQKLIAWAAKYAGDRQLGTDYRQQVEKLSPDMAKEVLYNGLRTKADYDKYLENVRGNSTSLKLEKEDIERGRELGVDVGQSIIEMHRNREDLEKKVALMADEEVKDEAFSKIEVNELGALTRRQRIDIAQATGQWGRSFHNPEGKLDALELNRAALAVGGATVAKTITASALGKDDNLEAALWHGAWDSTAQKQVRGMKFGDWNDMRKRGEQVSGALGNGFINALNEDDSEILARHAEDWKGKDQDKELAKVKNDMRSQAVKSKVGGIMPWDIRPNEDGTVSEGRLDWMKAMKNIKAEEVFQMNPDKLTNEKGQEIGLSEEQREDFLADFALSLRPSEMAQLLTYNQTLAQRSLVALKKRLENGKEITIGQKKQVQALSKNPITTSDFGYEYDINQGSLNVVGQTPASSTASTPTPTGSEPATTDDDDENDQQLRDTLIDQRGITKFDSTHEQVKAHEDLGDRDAFFASKEYRENPDKYLSKEEYEKLMVRPLSGILHFGKSNDASNTLRYDSRVAGFEQFEEAGEFITDPKRKQEFATAYVAQLDREIASLSAKASRTDGEETYLQRLQKTKERLSDPDQLADLEIINHARLGYTDRHAIAHERTHARLKTLDSDKSFRKALMDDMPKEKLAELVALMRRKMNDAEMSEEEAFNEYLVEGIVNQKKSWADTSEDAVTLDPAMMEKVQAHAIEKGGRAFTVSTPEKARVSAKDEDREHPVFKSMRLQTERAAEEYNAKVALEEKADAERKEQERLQKEAAKQAKIDAARARQIEVEQKLAKLQSEGASPEEIRKQEKIAKKAREEAATIAAGGRLGQVVQGVASMPGNVVKGVSEFVATQQQKEQTRRDEQFTDSTMSVAARRNDLDQAKQYLQTSKNIEDGIRRRLMEAKARVKAASEEPYPEVTARMVDEAEAIERELETATRTREDDEKKVKKAEREWGNAVQMAEKLRDRTGRTPKKAAPAAPASPSVPTKVETPAEQPAKETSAEAAASAPASAEKPKPAKKVEESKPRGSSILYDQFGRRDTGETVVRERPGGSSGNRRRVPRLSSADLDQLGDQIANAIATPLADMNTTFSQMSTRLGEAIEHIGTRNPALANSLQSELPNARTAEEQTRLLRKIEEGIKKLKSDSEKNNEEPALI